MVVAPKHRDASVLRDGEIRVEALAAGQRYNLAAGNIDTRQVRDAVALDEAQDRFAVGRPARLVERHVDWCGERRLAAGDVDDRQLPRRIVNPLILAAL